MFRLVKMGVGRALFERLKNFAVLAEFFEREEVGLDMRLYQISALVQVIDEGWPMKRY